MFRQRAETNGVSLSQFEIYGSKGGSMNFKKVFIKWGPWFLEPLPFQDSWDLGAIKRTSSAPTNFIAAIKDASSTWMLHDAEHL